MSSCEDRIIEVLSDAIARHVAKEFIEKYGRAFTDCATCGGTFIVNGGQPCPACEIRAEMKLMGEESRPSLMKLVDDRDTMLTKIWTCIEPHVGTMCVNMSPPYPSNIVALVIGAVHQLNMKRNETLEGFRQMLGFPSDEGIEHQETQHQYENECDAHLEKLKYLLGQTDPMKCGHPIGCAYPDDGGGCVMCDHQAKVEHMRKELESRVASSKALIDGGQFRVVSDERKSILKTFEEILS